jgi:signal transduction histidine kinase
VAQFAAAGLAAVLIVGLGTAAASRRVGQREAISDARSATLLKAQSVVEPAVTDGLAARDPEAVDAIAAVVSSQVLDRSIVRVKIWRADGTIVYSDVRALEGSRYRLGEEEVAALESGLIEAEVSDLTRPENRYERDFGKLLEVYLPIRTPDGERLLFEAYFRYDAVTHEGGKIWRSFAPISIGSLLILEIVQIPLAWSLAVRLRQRQREREALLQRAVEASDIERRRIATDLHDGVVQDLVGVSFELAGAAREGGMPPPAAALLDQASDSIRANITSLRSMLLDIYPPDLAATGLGPALEDLAADASSEALHVAVDAAALPDSLPLPVSQLLYRAAREGVRNVTAHAHATQASIEAGARDAAPGGRGRTTAWVSVTDDGVGFEPEAAEARADEGHLGLRGLRGVVQDVGGTFRVDTAPGHGTTMHVEVPVR